MSNRKPVNLPRQALGPRPVHQDGRQRELLFLVADDAIAAMVTGFFSGAKAPAHVLLGDCGQIDFDPHRDIVKHPGHDPGVWKHSAAFLRDRGTVNGHRRVVAILDDDWHGTPGPAKIREKILADLAADWEHRDVVVIEPELEAWFWRDHSELERLMLWRDKRGRSPRQVLEQAGLWPAGAGMKPPRPKEAVEYLRKQRDCRLNVQNATFGKVAGHLSARHCVDPAFQQLAATLRAWFPAESTYLSTSVEASTQQ